MLSRLSELQASPRYKKREAQLWSKLDMALTGLNAEKLPDRMTAMRSLRSESVRELGLLRYPVRQWFVARCGALVSHIRAELDTALTAELLRTTVFLWDRYITHPLWAECHGDGAEAIVRPVLAELTDDLADAPAAAIREKIASLMAKLGDTRAWDIYGDTLPKRTAEMSWLFINVINCGDSITAEQAERLITVLEKIILKTRNPSTKGYAERAAAALRDKHRRPSHPLP